MKINTIAPADGATTRRKRLGRGIGSGLGKTSGKGHKGQWARSGGGVRPGFEGGQMPLARRLPKRGFKSPFKAVYSIINLDDLKDFKKGAVVNAEILMEMGVIRKLEPYGLKVLGDGEIANAITVQAKKFSKSALEKIEKAGGKAEVIK
ncbi:MAG: 50S ribosomal protein L15 [Firmicutes bacterium]|nr:50S ribosomal protein L15 [Bacillota bacterium]